MPLAVSAHVELPGWHSWPNAPARREYLKALHRHLFHVTVELPVHHDDREVEFHDLADQIREWWGDVTLQMDRGSCERMATALAHYITRTLYTPRKVVVGEDGECWATWRCRKETRYAL